MKRLVLWTVTLAATGVLIAPPIRAQDQPDTPKPSFEVASIKPNTGGDRNRMIRGLPGGRLNVENLPLKFLIRFAYNVKEFLISGGPNWINTDPYDITAKAEGDPTGDQMRPMLQTLLEDRFKLILHRETKELPVYELVAAKGGIKLAAPKEGSCIVFDRHNPPPAPQQPGETPPKYCGNVMMGRGVLNAFGIPMETLLMELSDTLGRTVIDKTGFTGTFDVHLEFTPDEATSNGPFGQAGPGDPSRPAPSSDQTSPSIFTALEEQLGLKLQSSKGPVEVLVIDHVERPSEN